MIEGLTGIAPLHWQSGFTRDSDIEFRELLEQLPAAAYTTDADGLITYYNRPALELWGRAPVLRDAVDRWCGSFRLFEPAGDPIPHDRCWMALAIQEDRSYNGKEIVIERGDGSRRTVLAHANPIHDDDGAVRAAVNVLVDITERKLAELRLQEADEAKTEFLAMLAHELRNPLAAMQSSVEVAMRSEDDATRVRAEAVVGRQLHHLGRIVGDLVDVARITRRTLELRRESIELDEVIGQAIETSRTALDAAGQRLEITLPDEPIHLDADRVRLAQLFSNLLLNASKYSSPGDAISIDAARRGSEVMVTVRDRGIGVPPELQASIFEMFARAPAVKQDGLGVGLTLAAHLAHLHGGSIEVQSDGPGHGSAFSVRLPIEAAAPGTTRAPDDVAGPAAAQRILVVDDNHDAGDALAALLELDGNEVHVAHDGEAALRLADRIRPQVVLLDIGLPGMSGYEVAERMRTTDWGASALLLAVTGWGHPDDRQRSERAGFDEHLIKPIEIEALEALVARHAARSGD